MAEDWNVDSLIEHLRSIPEDYNFFMDNLLEKCWELRVSKKIENNKALNILYDIQCGYRLFLNESETFASIFNNFFEDIARCGPDCTKHLHYDPYRYLNRFEKNRLVAELERVELARETSETESEDNVTFGERHRCRPAAYMGRLDGEYLTKEKETRYNVVKYLGKKPSTSAKKSSGKKENSVKESRDSSSQAESDLD